MAQPRGYTDQRKFDRTAAQETTTQPVDEYRFGADTLVHSTARVVASDATEAGTTAISIAATSHLAKRGDTVRFTSGTFNGEEVAVYAVTANTITLGTELDSVPADGDTFDILRHQKPAVDAFGSTLIAPNALAAPYTVRLSYDASNNLEYVGFAIPGSASSGAVWQIRKLTYSSSNLTLVQWADGNQRFDNIWDNRASLSYS